MKASNIKTIGDYNNFYNSLAKYVSEYKKYFDLVKETSSGEDFKKEISSIEEEIKNINNSRLSKFAIDIKRKDSTNSTRITYDKTEKEINRLEQELIKILDLFKSQLVVLEKRRESLKKLGSELVQKVGIANTKEVEKANIDINEMVSSTPSIKFYEEKQISDWLKNRNELIEKAEKLKNVNDLYINARTVFKFMIDSAVSVDKKANDIVDNYFSDKASGKLNNISAIEEYYSKYISVVANALKETIKDGLKSSFDILVNLYTDAKSKLESSSAEEKKLPVYLAAMSRIEAFFGAKKVLDENKADDKTDAMKTFIGEYKRYYNADVQGALKELKKTPKEVLTKEEFDKKSLAGKIEYASKTGNALGKTVADVIKDLKYNLGDWQKQEILNAHSKGVTPIEMASIADKIDRLNKTPISLRNSFIPKFSKIAKIREAKQDTVQDYKTLLTDMRIAIMSLPIQDITTNSAISLINDALVKNTVEDMQKAYDVALSIQNNPDYMNKEDTLRQQYDYYYADNKEVPFSAQLLETDNGRKIMQNMVNIAKAKTEQLRDIPNTAGSQKFRSDIEDKTNKAITQTVNVIKSIQQKQKQVDIQRKDEATLRELRKIAPDVKPVATIQDTVTWQKPDEKMVLNQMKEDLTSIVENISEQLKTDSNFIEALTKAQKALIEKNVNEFYRNYRILEQMKNTDALKVSFVAEYQNMIQQLNNLKAGKQDMIVIDINNAINKISELFKIGTEESINNARNIYNEMIAVIKSKEVGVNTQVIPPVNEPVNKEPLTMQGETKTV